MVLKVKRRATTKASLLRALRANDVSFSNVKTLKRAKGVTTGLYEITFKEKK